MRLSRGRPTNGSRNRDLTVRLLSRRSAAGRLVGLGLDVPCAIGRGGVTAVKREGDGKTPAGRHAVLSGRFRADRMRRPASALPLRAIRPRDGWCDAPADRNYNRPVALPYPASCESLCRADGVYDVVIVLDVNIRRRLRGRGSAIFFHLARPGHTPTEGCVAVSRADMAKILGKIRPGCRIVVPGHERPRPPSR